MAVSLAYRVAIALASQGYRLVRASEGPGADQVTGIPTSLWDRLQDPAESPADLSEALNAATGIMWEVADYAEPFELRKAQVRWGRSSGAAAGTDDAVTTHHFVKLASGVPTAAWDAADFLAVEAAMTAFWNGIKENWRASIVLKQIRWYKAGPAIVPPQVPVRIVDPAIAGTAEVGYQQTPQVALTVTEKTSDPKSWGRFYLPAPRSETYQQDNGRASTTFITDIADNADTMYEAFLSASCPAVVYSSPKPSRSTAGGGTLAARDGRALGVNQIQVDDLFDVIRSRRWNEPLLRLQRAIGA